MAFDAKGEYVADNEQKWHSETAWNRMLQNWLDNLHIASQDIMLLTTKPEHNVKSDDLFRIRSYLSITNMVIYHMAKLKSREEIKKDKGYAGLMELDMD